MTLLRSLPDRWRAYRHARRAAGERKRLRKAVARLESLNVRRRRDAIRDLYGLGTPEATAALVRALNDPDPQVRLDVGDRLAHLEAPEALGPLLRLFESDPDSWVRCMAGLYLNRFDDPRGPDAWIAALSDPDPQVIGSACNGITRRRITGAIPALFRLLDDVRGGVHVEVCGTLAELGVRDARATETLFSLLEDPSGYVRRGSWRALIDLGVRDARIIATLEALKGDPAVSALERFTSELAAGPRRKGERGGLFATYRTIDDLLEEARRPPAGAVEPGESA